MNELKKMTATEHAEIWGDETPRKAYNVQSLSYRAEQIDALHRIDLAWIELLLEREVFGSIEVGFDPEGFRRTCKEKLTAIRAIRKELGI